MLIDWLNDDCAVEDGGQQSSRGHIFISYQWDSKPTVLMIRDRLKRSGVNIWVDVDNMSMCSIGSFLLSSSSSSLSSSASSSSSSSSSAL